MPYLEANEAKFHYLESGDGPVSAVRPRVPIRCDDVERTARRAGRVAAVPCYRPQGVRSQRPVATPSALHGGPCGRPGAFLDKGSVAAAVNLVGISMGGYVALAFAELYPERIRSIALIDTKSTADSEQAMAGRDATAARGAPLGPSHAAVLSLIVLLLAEIVILRMVDEDTGGCAAAETDVDAVATAVVESG